MGRKALCKDRRVCNSPCQKYKRNGSERCREPQRVNYTRTDGEVIRVTVKQRDHFLSMQEKLARKKSPKRGAQKSPKRGAQKSPTRGAQKSPTRGAQKSPTCGAKKSPLQTRPSSQPYKMTKKGDIRMSARAFYDRGGREGDVHCYGDKCYRLKLRSNGSPYWG